MAYLVGNLNMIRADIRAHFTPDPTIYWLGDASHMARKSDHNPDWAGRVHAIDVMYNVGAKASAVVRACVGRPDLAYVIHNRTIWSATYGWRARHYSGTDPHRNHVHISGKHTVAARNNRTHLKWAGGTTTPTKPAPKPAARPSTSIPKYPGELHYGSRGSAVKTLQNRLNARGYTPRLRADGMYGPSTRKQVKDFQKYAKIRQDGIVGPQTWDKLWRLPIT